MEFGRPRWTRDLLRFLPLRSQFVISGNVRDQYPVSIGGGTIIPMPLISALAVELRAAGIVHFLIFDPAQGFTVPRIAGLDVAAEQQFFAGLLNLSWKESGRVAASTERFFEVVETIARYPSEPIALFADFASRLLTRPDQPTEAEQRGFTRALVLSHAAGSRPHGPEGTPFFNPIFWIVEKEGDLPDWFVVGKCSLPISTPKLLAEKLAKLKR